MEQKQLDEMEESFFGEEFVDEEDFTNNEFDSSKKEKNDLKKDNNIKSYKKNPAKRSKYIDLSETAAEKEEVQITPAKEPLKENPLKENKEKIVETSSAVDPWAKDQNSDADMFGTTFWKVLTAIAVILLIISIFTQGFGYKNNSNANSAATLSLEEAEDKATQFVNTNLLEQPFEAKVDGSSDLGNLYKFTFDIAGQKVDSYITKDGKLFFPQGFDTNYSKLDSVVVNNTNNNITNGTTEENLANEEITTENNQTETSKEVIVDATNSINNSSQSNLSTTSTTSTNTSKSVQEFTIKFKKWSFTPEKLTVKKGQTVRLKLIADETNPTFALTDFTFSIPDLSLEQKITKSGLVEFVANKAGTFVYKCKECEDWRGMSGQITVQ